MFNRKTDKEKICKKIRNQIFIENAIADVKCHCERMIGISPLKKKTIKKIENFENLFPGDIEKEIERRYQIKIKKNYGKI